LKHEQWKLDLIQKRGYVCEFCHLEPATELHHALIGRNKNIPELDIEYNLMCVCHNCHETEIHGRAVKIWFWGIQCQRYGITVMTKWLNGLPLKIKPELYVI
jgi:hypothetical protein